MSMDLKGYNLDGT